MKINIKNLNEDKILLGSSERRYNDYLYQNGKIIHEISPNNVWCKNYNNTMTDDEIDKSKQITNDIRKNCCVCGSLETK
jgi:hypothetical protein